MRCAISTGDGKTEQLARCNIWRQAVFLLPEPERLADIRNDWSFDMTLLKRRIAGALAVIGVASLITFLQVEANHETDDQIGEEAIWNAAPEDLGAIGQACKITDAARYQECFIEQMGEYASSDAVAFTQMMASQKSRRLGISNRFARIRTRGPGVRSISRKWAHTSGMGAAKRNPWRGESG